MNRIVWVAMIGSALICGAASADTMVNVNPANGWIGFMNVSGF